MGRGGRIDWGRRLMRLAVGGEVKERGDEQARECRYRERKGGRESNEGHREKIK